MDSPRIRPSGTVDLAAAERAVRELLLALGHDPESEHLGDTPGRVARAYEERANCVPKQYDGYVAVDDVHLNGRLTLGENIGDIGGLKMMISALRAKRQGQAPTDAGGFNDEQQAFIAFAQVWCTNYRPEAARTQALTNPHSTAQWRVNGPVSDNPDFATTFGCGAGAPMAPINRCTVW